MQHDIHNESNHILDETNDVCLSITNTQQATDNQSLSISYTRPHQTQHNLTHQSNQFIGAGRVNSLAQYFLSIFLLTF
jgi:hypothetical protein